MQRYLKQLLAEISEVKLNLSWPYIQKESYHLQDVLSQEEEEANATVRHLPEWAGIVVEMLPPSKLLNDEELNQFLDALKSLLEECNCHFVLQTQLPEDLQYEAIRQNWSQEIKVLEWNMGFFALCKPGTLSKTCTLGEYCQCAFYAELLKDKEDEDLTPEEARTRNLEIEVQHLKRKYSEDWMKYYPYHLDQNYDDENGNPYNYGIEDDDDSDSWWKK